jgi:hypothetical protein
VPLIKAELKSPKGISQAQGTEKASPPDNPIGRSKNLESIVSPGRGGSPKATSGTGEESDQSGSTSETCERASEEANSTRRKLGRKLPAMGGTKEHLSALKASQQQKFPNANERTGGVGSPTGDFSICDSSIGVSSESFEEIHGNLREYQQLNRRLGRAKGKSVTCAPSATSPTSPTAPGRDTHGSPTTSPSHHEADRSGALSGSRSPEVDNLSDRNSVLSGSRSPEVSLPRANQSHSHSGSPATSPHSSAHSNGTQSEPAEEIVSLDGDDISGSGSIDLALGRGTSGDGVGFGTGTSNTSQFVQGSPAPELDNDVEDSIEEDVDNFENNSHSGYESSDAHSGGF